MSVGGCECNTVKGLEQARQDKKSPYTCVNRTDDIRIEDHPWKEDPRSNGVRDEKKYGGR